MAKNDVSNANTFITTKSREGRYKVRTVYNTRTNTTERYLEETEVSHKSVLAIIFMIMFFVMYFQVVFGVGTGFTFTGLLNALSSAPSIDISWMSRLTSFKLDIPVIGALVNFMVGVISVMVYLSVGIAQLVVYVGFILGLLTGVV